MIYLHTYVACDSRYTRSTVRKLTPRAAAVLSRDLSITIIILPVFFSVSKNFLRLLLSFDSTVAFGMMVAYVFGIY